MDTSPPASYQEEYQQPYQSLGKNDARKIVCPEKHRHTHWLIVVDKNDALELQPLNSSSITGHGKNDE